MIALLRLMMSVDLIAIGIENLVPVAHTHLPLGGSHLAQLGIILIVLVFVIELRDYMRERRERGNSGTIQPD